MSQNDTDYMWPCFTFLFAFDQHLYFPIVLLLFRHLFLKAYLCVFCSSCYLKLYLLIVMLLLFPCFLLHPFQVFLVPTYFFSRLCQGTTGPEGQSTTRPQDQNHRTRGPEDHRTRGPQGQRSLNFFSRGCKYFFHVFPGNVIFCFQYHPCPCFTQFARILPHIHYITLHYITLHYITLHCITLHCIRLHYITLYQSGNDSARPISHFLRTRSP